MPQDPLNNKWPGDRTLLFLMMKCQKMYLIFYIHIKIHKNCGRRVSKCDQNKTNASFE